MVKQKDKMVEDILKWYNNRKYIRIGSDVSVTELLDPPRLVHLRDRHKPQIKSTDLSGEIPALVGTGTHSILQNYLRTESYVSNSWLIERRMTAVVNDVRIAGKFDALKDLKHMYDIKVTRVWKYIYGNNKDFERQLNMYDYFMHLDGYEIETLKIMMVILDWSEGKKWERGYPNSRIQIIPIKKWSRTQQKKFIEDRVNSWKAAKPLADDKLPECSLDDRWAEKEVHKLYRLPNAQKAYKIFNTKTGAKSYQDVCQANEPKKWDKSIIKTFRAKPWKRCESWCKVADFCNQYQNRIK